jgi:GTP-binding protein HflX
VLITREGGISHVIVGDAHSVFIPSLDMYPLGRSPLRRLRFIHTHLKDEPLNNEDITDLALLRFDLIAAISIKDGLPHKIYAAHLMPHGSARKYEYLTDTFYQFNLDFADFVANLESEMERSRSFDRGDARERAILVSAGTKPKYELEESMEELRELAESSDVLVLDTVVQRLKAINPKALMGEGKLKEIIMNAMDTGATLLIFDQNLTPSQVRTIGETTELKVIDRSQLILDIFARRAHSRDGKVQVELAQLKYNLPRLTGKGTAMSRLMGGIGGRGPGEMKLEIDRRRIRDRITRLEKELQVLGEARRQRKQRRVTVGIPIVSIIGYTNAGKSTLLNALTNSDTFVENRMFATLDTASRRLRFPKEREIIITDTVGFIRDLPEDLLAAFKATLEELEDADLLLHLVDISNHRFEQQIASVEAIMSDLGIRDKKRLIVFNKTDRIEPEEAQNIAARYDGLRVSALNRETLTPLLEAIEVSLWENGSTNTSP